jgi:hypothetical protein
MQTKSDRIAHSVCSGGGYAVFAGKEVSRALGLMSLEADDCCGELADLTPRQLEVLDEWVAKFRGKYHVVGRVGRHAGGAPALVSVPAPHVLLWLDVAAGCTSLGFYIF